MNGTPEVCAEERSRIEIIVHRFSRWSWWYTMPIASVIHTWTRKHVESPHFNRWLAGIAEACWTHVCGHGILYSLHIGAIYWFPKRRGPQK